MKQTIVFSVTASSHPQPPNYCTEAVIDHDHIMIMYKQPHRTKQLNNQSATLLPVFVRSIQFLHNADSYSHAEGQSSMNIE